MDTNKNHPDLDARIADWKQMFAHTALTTEDVEELSLHLKENYYDLLSLELSEDEAWMIASHRIGKPEVIKEEFEKVNGNFTINRNWLMLLWGAVSLLILQAVFILVPLFFQTSILNYFKPSNNSDFMAKEYYTIAVILVLLFALMAIKSGRFINSFSNSLTKYASLYAIVAIVAGLWAIFFNQMIFAKYFISGNGIPLHDDIGKHLNFLMFGFYFPLIAITAYSTLRYFSSEMTSLKVFNKNITWTHAFILGLIAQTPIQFGHAIPGEFALRAAIIIILSVVLFMVTGWMISYSKKGVLNLAFAQIVPLLVWILVLPVLPADQKTIFFIFYLVKVLALLAGYYLGKQKQNQLALT